MGQIKFTDLLKLSEDEHKHLKLVFNSDWNYEPDGRPESVRKVYGEKPRKLNLLEMYGHGQADLVKKSTTSHNPLRAKRFRNGEVVFTFIHYADKDWLLVDAFKVLDDSKYFVEVDEESMAKYEPYFGRLVITWSDRATRNVRMKNKEAIEKLTVRKILEKPYSEIAVEFPGYENIDLSWRDLKYVLGLKNWQTALRNQKGVYLITDTKTGKRYVGSASGDEMLLGRWQAYAKTGHGGNEELKKLPFDYIKENFRYSILDIYKSKVDDEKILERESWWKNILLTRDKKYGYNDN